MYPMLMGTTVPCPTDAQALDGLGKLFLPGCAKQASLEAKYMPMYTHLDDTRNELLRNCPSLDLGHELETGARLSRLKADLHVGKLAGAARLLLVDVAHVCRTRQGLAVVDLQG